MLQKRIEELETMVRKAEDEKMEMKQENAALVSCVEVCSCDDVWSVEGVASRCDDVWWHGGV